MRYGLITALLLMGLVAVFPVVFAIVSKPDKSQCDPQLVGVDLRVMQQAYDVLLAGHRAASLAILGEHFQAVNANECIA